MKKIILIVILLLTSLNWMFLSESKLKWDATVLNFIINPNFNGFKSVKNQNYFIQEIVSASGAWYQKTETNIHFRYKGVANDKPSSLENISCNEKTRKDLQQNDIVFYADTNGEYECDSSSCVFVWSCLNTIVHADVVFNNEDFTYSEIGTDGENIFLRSEALRSFGYILGLGHCSPGDKKEDCLSKGGSDPEPNSLMYKFSSLGKLQNLTSDEVLGVETIYGKKKSLFPKEGKYAMTYKELYSVLEIQEVETIAGINSLEGKKSNPIKLNSLLAYNKRKTGKEVKVQYDEFFSHAYSLTPELSKAELEFQLLTLNLGIIAADGFKEDVQKGLLNLDIGLLDYIIQKHHQLRNYTKDNLESK